MMKICLELLKQKYPDLLDIAIYSEKRIARHGATGRKLTAHSSEADDNALKGYLLIYYPI
jgi:hypothetical protein